MYLIYSFKALISNTYLSVALGVMQRFQAYQDITLIIWIHSLLFFKRFFLKMVELLFFMCVFLKHSLGGVAAATVEQAWCKMSPSVLCIYPLVDIRTEIMCPILGYPKGKANTSPRFLWGLCCVSSTFVWNKACRYERTKLYMHKTSISSKSGCQRNIETRDLQLVMVKNTESAAAQLNTSMKESRQPSTDLPDP